MQFASAVPLRTIFFVGSPTWNGNVNVIIGNNAPVEIFVSSRANPYEISFDGNNVTVMGRYALNGGAISGYARDHFYNLPASFVFYGDYQGSAQSFTHLLCRPTSLFYNGDISEILAFNRLLTGDEMNRVGRYLQEKYNIAGAYPAVLDVPYVTPGAAIQVSETEAQFSATVKNVMPNTNAVLRVYYGKTDGVAVPSAWWASEVVEAAATNAVYTRTTTVPLAVGDTYFYRFST